MCPETLCFIVDFPEDNLLWSKLSPGQSTSKQVVPPDTLLRSKLSSGHFTSKQTVPSQGGNLLRGGSLSFEVKCPGRTVYFEVKCPGDSLLRSNSPPGHYTSGGKLLRDRTKQKTMAGNTGINSLAAKLTQERRIKISTWGPYYTLARHTAHRSY